ncbi:hypothetical protein [Dyadobacter sp. CY356]|uniref:hypothetical protein n=1 Tax=Dyadobacter sp. CY356 TaxID=2906442 RepID=UPI001F2933B0|nr:hypothetical protein [Dyadobacter sp. CY356]MCF0055447.1 hypothetical protein [Dyadobacter sp. CY356]
MEDQTFLDELVSRYLSNDATLAELEVFLFLLKEGKLDETLSRIVNAQIALDTETDDTE